MIASDNLRRTGEQFAALVGDSSDWGARDALWIEECGNPQQQAVEKLKAFLDATIINHISNLSMSPHYTYHVQSISHLFVSSAQNLAKRRKGYTNRIQLLYPAPL